MTERTQNNKIKLYFWLIILLQTVFLIFMISAKQYTLNTGTSILLETLPIDPRPLFSGDYVRVSYTINTLNLNQVPGDHNFKMGEKVYVTLQSGIAFWSPVMISKTKGTPKSGQVIIQGIATSESDFQNNRNLTITYGIEQYFVPEAEGKKLEQLSGNKQLSVIVKVDKLGHAAIAGLTSLGQEIYQETLF